MPLTIMNSVQRVFIFALACDCIKYLTVWDPACGTGGMLIEAIRQMHNEQAAYGKIFGQEKNLSTSAIARMNLFLHGAKEFKILREDTLLHPQFLQGGTIRKFDCVLAIIWSSYQAIQNVQNEESQAIAA